MSSKSPAASIVPHDVIESFHSPARICPMLAGAALIDGDTLLVRLIDRDVEVAAPRRVLRQLFELCDGTRSVDAILTLVPSPERKPFRAFVQRLLSSGALIDASLATAASLQLAVNGNAFGESVPRQVWNQTPRRWHGLKKLARNAASVANVPSDLDSLLRTRITTSTFGDGAIDEAALLKWLWTFGGILHEQHENEVIGIARRTIPSGGAIHAVRPVLVLQKAVGSYRAGIYNVLYPAAERVLLVHVSDDLRLLVRAMAKPSYLMHATGIVFLVADPRLVAIKYRARSTQYLLIETGTALQNAALAAPSLGIATGAFGSYYEDVVATVCKLTDEIVLCSAIFGSPPSAEQLARYRQVREFEFAWAEGPSTKYSLPYFLARTTAFDDSKRVLFTWGRDTDPWMAYRKSTAEAIERQGFFTAKAWTAEKLTDMANAIDPRSVIRYAARQYRRQQFPFKPFDPKRICAWAPAQRVLTGSRHWVLADLVYAQRALKAENAPLAQYAQGNSSGCAAGVTWQSAVEAAAYELVERDAFMRAWFAQASGTEVGPRSLPASYQKRLQALRSIGCTVKIQSLPSPWSNVMLASAQNSELGFTSVGTGARDDPLEAIESALVELETYVYIRSHRAPVEPISPRKVRFPEHHALLYANPAFFRRADALLRPRRTQPLSALTSLASSERIVERLESGGVAIYASDITPVRASLDQGRTNLFVARVVAPGLIPISFGFGLEPLGMVARYEPQALFPHPLP